MSMRFGRQPSAALQAVGTTNTPGELLNEAARLIRQVAEVSLSGSCGPAENSHSVLTTAPTHPKPDVDDGAAKLSTDYSWSALRLPSLSTEVDDRLRALWRFVAGLVQRLEQTELALRAREAQLATSIPVVERADEGPHLADRLEALLRLATQTVEATAAGLYLLDEATSELKLRAVWNLPRERLLAPPRPLAHQLADLEALLGHAVVVDNQDSQLLWCPPEPAESAICLPVSTPSIPLGTLWVFDQHRRTFSDHQVELLEVISGRIAGDLERHVLLKATSQWQRQLREREQWLDAYRLQMPALAPWLDRWRFTACYHRPQRELPREFYDWGVLPDGRAYLIVGACHGNPALATVRAVGLRSVVQSHLPKQFTADGLLRAVHETLWSGSTGDWQGSLFCAFLDDHSGALEYAGTGSLGAWVVGKRHYKQLPLSNQPLGKSNTAQISSGRVTVPAHGLLCIVGPSYVKAFSHLSTDYPAIVGRRLCQVGSRPDCHRTRLANRVARLLQKLNEGTGLDEATVLVAHRIA